MSECEHKFDYNGYCIYCKKSKIEINEELER